MNRPAVRGATLAELLAAVLVVAVGVVGVAALYSQSTPVVEDALGQQAMALAQEMAGHITRMPSGREGFASTIGVVCQSDFDASRAAPHEQAAQEAACWEDAVEAALPSGYGAIVRDTSTTPVSYVVTVSWSAPGAGAASYVIRVTE